MKINPMQSTASQTPCKLSDVPYCGTFVIGGNLFIKLSYELAHGIKVFNLSTESEAWLQPNLDVIQVACEISFLNDKP